MAFLALYSSPVTGLPFFNRENIRFSLSIIVAAIAGDTSQDLKTGYLLGATPKKQQIGELIGVVAAGLAIGGAFRNLLRATKR